VQSDALVIDCLPLSAGLETFLSNGNGDLGPSVLTIWCSPAITGAAKFTIDSISVEKDRLEQAARHRLWEVSGKPLSISAGIHYAAVTRTAHRGGCVIYGPDAVAASHDTALPIDDMASERLFEANSKS